ncbi:MAG: dihydroorotase family protein [Solirubrobacteraceae bacterium]|nr:dihydroorotase family protein [Solirubrobacteraceae bacterium]
MTSVDLLVRDARVHVAAGEVVEGWLAVRGGRVAAVGTGPEPAADVVHDAGGRDVMPGAIDTHVHFRDPGDTEKEDFSTGSLAAAFGGVTTVVDMPNTGHLVITPDDFREKRDLIAGRSWVDFGLHANFNDSAAYVSELAELGVASLKLLFGYGDWKGLRCHPSTYAELRATLLEAVAAGVLVMVHAESLPWLVDLGRALRAEGRTDVNTHFDSRPPFVEAISVAETAILAAEFGCRMHIVHLTGELPLRTAIALRDELDAPLTVETCPQYMFLTDEDVAAQGVSIQANPPIRTERDKLAMWEGIRNGTIHSIASDHAPNLPEDKVRDNPLDALPGVLGVETMLPLLLDSVARGRLTLPRVIELLCAHPAELVRLDDRKGALLPGHDADLAIVDLEAQSTISGETLHSKQRFTPYEGRELRGAIGDVFLRGRPLVVDGRLAAEKPFGTYTPSQYAAAVGSTAARAGRLA